MDSTEWDRGFTVLLVVNNLTGAVCLMHEYHTPFTSIHEYYEPMLFYVTLLPFPTLQMLVIVGYKTSRGGVTCIETSGRITKG